MQQDQVLELLNNKMVEEKKQETKVEEKKVVENKTNSAPKETEKSKPVKIEKVNKKTEAVVNGKDLSVSLKHAVAICNFIKGKEIDKAIFELEEVTKLKRAVPMRGEIPHRKGNMMSGRYPTKAAGIYVKLLKSLKSNAIANEMELEKYQLHAIPNLAPRPFRRFGQGRFKRSHVAIKLVPITIKKNSESKVLKKKIKI